MSEDIVKKYLTTEEYNDYKHLQAVYSRSDNDPLDQYDVDDAMFDLELLAFSRQLKEAEHG